MGKRSIDRCPRYLTQAKQRVKDHQDAAGRAQDVNGAVNNDLRNQQSTAQQSANQTHKDAGRSYSNMHTSQVSTNGDASPKGDTYYRTMTLSL